MFKILAALAVALTALMGSAGTAQAAPITELADTVCEYYDSVGVSTGTTLTLLETMNGSGMTPRVIGQTVGYAVVYECPWHASEVAAIMEDFADGNIDGYASKVVAR